MISPTKKNYIVSMVILSGLFFIFGLVSWVNTILIPYFKFTCELSIVQSYFVTFAFFIAYLIMAIPASHLLNKIGYKRGMMIGLWIMALGALLFVPAAYFRAYPIFLTGLFSLGIGLAILQSAANPYVTIIGDKESAASRLSIVGTFNKLAGILANLIFAAVVIGESDRKIMEDIKNGLYLGVARAEALDQLIRSVIMPYSILAIVLFGFGFIVRYSVLPEIDNNTKNASQSPNNDERKSIFQFPHLILGVLAIFFHVGSQMISLATIINYAGTMGLSLEGQAKNFPSYTMTFTFFGYLLGIFLIPKVISQKNALLISTILGFVLSLFVIFVHFPVRILGLETDISIWFLVLMGLPNALIYAGIWPLAIRELGKLTNLGSSLLVMGLSGSAIIPLIYSTIAEKYTMTTAYWILIPCFVYLMFYATVGYKIKNWWKISR
jgi:MFS transporter, FHS family, L-fucose permease